MATSSHTAFFSYSRYDSAFALRLAEDLKAAGASVWMDQLDISPGQEWDSAIEHAVTQSPRRLLILSPASVQSRNVRNEIAFALDEQKTIIPVLYQDCAIPLQLRRIQHIDFRIDYARGLQVLIKVLRMGEPTVVSAIAQSPPPPPYASLAPDTEARGAAQARAEEEEHERQPSARQPHPEEERGEASETTSQEREEENRKTTEESALQAVHPIQSIGVKERQLENDGKLAAARDALLEQKELERITAPEKSLPEQVRDLWDEEHKKSSARRLSMLQFIAAETLCVVGWSICLSLTFYIAGRGGESYDAEQFIWVPVSYACGLCFLLGSAITSVAARLTQRWPGWRRPLLFGCAWAGIVTVFAFLICVMYSTPAILWHVSVVAVPGAILGALVLRLENVSRLFGASARVRAGLLLSIPASWSAACLGMFTVFRTVFQFFGTYRLPSYFREFCEFSYNNLRMPLHYFPYYVPDDLYVIYPHVYLWGPLTILLSFAMAGCGPCVAAFWYIRKARASE